MKYSIAEGEGIERKKGGDNSLQESLVYTLLEHIV